MRAGGFQDSLGNQISYYCELFQIPIAFGKIIWTKFTWSKIIDQKWQKSCLFLNVCHPQGIVIWIWTRQHISDYLLIPCRELHQRVNIQAHTMMPPFPPQLISLALRVCWMVKQTCKWLRVQVHYCLAAVLISAFAAHCRSKLQVQSSQEKSITEEGY